MNSIWQSDKMVHLVIFSGRDFFGRELMALVMDLESAVVDQVGKNLCFKFSHFLQCESQGVC